MPGGHAELYCTLTVTVCVAEGRRWGRRAPHAGILLISSIGVPNHFLLLGRGGGVYLAIFLPGLWGLKSHFSFLLLKYNALKHFISTEKTGRQIHKLPPRGYNNSSQFICQPLPQAKALFWGELPPPPTFPSPRHTSTCLPKHPFLQADKPLHSGLARQGIPLQSHAPSQQDLFIHGQCPSKDVQNYFLALLEGLESSKKLHVIPKYTVLLFLLTP